MAMYELDTTAARETEDSGKFLKSPGKYKGKIVGAELIKANTGTDGIEITFEEDSTGRRANYLRLYTQKSSGEKIYGYKVLCAIMTCLRLRSLDPADGTVERFNKDTKKTEKEQGIVFPALIGKRIGFLLQGEEYRDASHAIKTKLAIMAPFEADTELTASEILDKKITPQSLAKLAQQLADNPVRKLVNNDNDDYKDYNKAHAKAYAQASRGEGYQGNHTPQSTSNFIDDEIPF